MKYLVQLRPPQFVFLLALSLTAIAGLAIQSEADTITITINDSNEAISASTTDTSGRVHVVECPDPAASLESCLIVVTQPGAATISSANFPFPPGSTTVAIGDPGGSTVSDTLGYGPCSLINCSGGDSAGPPFVAYSLRFNSDPATETPSGILGNSCSAVGGCQINELGVEQLAG